LEVIQELKPDITKEQLENLGVIDAVATTTDSPDIYSVRGILAAVPDDGTEVTIAGSDGVAVEGETTQSIAAAGEVEWPKVTVSGDAEKPTLTVTRKDSGAASVITFEKVDLNGHWEGTLTITDITLPTQTTSAQSVQGCSPELITGLLEYLKNKPMPLTMDITADKSGKGTVVWLLDMESVIKKLNTEEGTDISATNKPETFTFTVSGNTLTFQVQDQLAEGVTATMTGTVSQQGGAAVIDGTMTASTNGFSETAVWTVTKKE
jgi:hypothetical protein